MSRASDLPNTVEAARDFVQRLRNMGCIDKVMLAGSRSPSHHKKPHEGSDWDFVAVTKIANLAIPHPRITQKLMHADLIVVDAECAAHVPHAVEIWPTDVHGVLA